MEVGGRRPRAKQRQVEEENRRIIGMMGLEDQSRENLLSIDRLIGEGRFFPKV